MDYDYRREMKRFLLRRLQCQLPCPAMRTSLRDQYFELSFCSGATLVHISLAQVLTYQPSATNYAGASRASCCQWQTLKSSGDSDITMRRTLSPRRFHHVRRSAMSNRANTWYISGQPHQVSIPYTRAQLKHCGSNGVYAPQHSELCPGLVLLTTL